MKKIYIVNKSTNWTTSLQYKPGADKRSIRVDHLKGLKIFIENFHQWATLDPAKNSAW
jgi:hypothetical protein